MRDTILKNNWQISLSGNLFERSRFWLEKHALKIIIFVLSIISVASFVYYYQNGLGLAYNDARSHLDIGRRVVEGLKPGFAQLGSVWLPLTHMLMVLSIWNDFMWHSGLAGALQSMIAFVATGVLIYLFLKEISVGLLGRFIGVVVFAANINILYLQSTAMTELMLLATMTAGAFFLLLWYKNNSIFYLVQSAFWIMLSTLVRYDGWFLLFFAALLIFIYNLKKQGFKTTEGLLIFFCTLGGFGVLLWLVWNKLIFKDALYFIFGPFSAYAQQTQLEQAGNLFTKGNWWLSFKFYFYALAYNSGAFTLMLGVLGALVLWFSKNLAPRIRYATVALVAPLVFNVLALYLGHSVLYIQGLSGESWFNVRYGIMLMPSIAIFVGYLVGRARYLKYVIIGSLIFVTFFQFANGDAVSIDDAQVGSSQKNVSEVSSWLRQHTKDEKGFILISAASHDAVIFSSGLPMKKFIHEGTGAYWESAIQEPDRWARWIVMRTYSLSDSTYRLTKDNSAFTHYDLVDHYPFVDVYQIKPEYLDGLITEPILKQK